MIGGAADLFPIQPDRGGANCGTSGVPSHVTCLVR